jgi:chromosome segregation ATPase
MGNPKPRAKKKFFRLENLAKACDMLATGEPKGEIAPKGKENTTAKSDKPKTYQKRYYNERQKHTHANESVTQLRSALKEMQGRNHALAKEVEIVKRQVEIVEAEKNGAVQQLREKLEKEATLRTEICSHSRRLAKHVQRVPEIKERTAAKARKAGIKSATEISLKDGNGYSAQARELAREVVQYGMPVEKAGDAIQRIGKVLGVSMHEKMSVATVRQAEIEGGVIGDLQLAYEMANSPGE